MRTGPRSTSAVASASSISALGAASLVVLAAAVSGCATTQDANKRASINADRTLASRERLVLRGTDRHVHVVSTTTINGEDGSAGGGGLPERGGQPRNHPPTQGGPPGGGARETPAHAAHFP